MELTFCTWVCRPGAPVKILKRFFVTKEFQLKLHGNPYPHDFHNLHRFTKPEGNLSCTLWLSLQLSDVSPDEVCCAQLCSAPECPPLGSSREIPAALFPSPASSSSRLFSFPNEPGLLCFLCSLFHVTGAEWLLKMRGDEECEEGSSCLWSEPDWEWWKPHGLWRSPVQLFVYRAP